MVARKAGLDMRGSRIACVLGITSLLVGFASVRLGGAGAGNKLRGGFAASLVADPAPTATTTPDPFGTDEQVLASLSAAQRANVDKILEPRARITRARKLATELKFTGHPGELQWFLAAINEETVPASLPVNVADEYWMSERGRVCDLLRSIGVAWMYAGPFEGLEERVVDAAARFADHPDELIRGQAGLVLHSVGHVPGRDPRVPLPPRGEAALRALMSDEEDRKLVETYIRGVLEHTRELREGRGPE